MKNGIYYTNGTGIFRVESLIRAAVLKNLETGETQTREIIGSNIEGFEIIKLPKVRQKTTEDKHPPHFESKVKQGGETDNTVQPGPKGKSGFLGVCFRKREGKYFAQIAKSKKNGKYWAKSGFATAEEAKAARDAELTRRGINFQKAP
jgi:hypothetical protein